MEVIPHNGKLVDYIQHGMFGCLLGPNRLVDDGEDFFVGDGFL